MRNPQMVDCINHLIQSCKDREFGLRRCAQHAQRDDLKHLLAGRADAFSRGAGELQTLVVQQLRGSPGDRGTVHGALHRWWVIFKGAWAGYSDSALIEDCERGEEAALEHYRSALERDLPPIWREPLQRQFERIERSRAQLRELREREGMAHA